MNIREVPRWLGTATLGGLMLSGCMDASSFQLPPEEPTPIAVQATPTSAEDPVLLAARKETFNAWLNVLNQYHGDFNVSVNSLPDWASEENVLAKTTLVKNPNQPPIVVEWDLVRKKPDFTATKFVGRMLVSDLMVKSETSKLEDYQIEDGVRRIYFARVGFERAYQALIVTSPAFKDQKALDDWVKQPVSEPYPDLSGYRGELWGLNFTQMNDGFIKRSQNHRTKYSENTEKFLEGFYIPTDAMYEATMNCAQNNKDSCVRVVETKPTA